MVHLAFVRAERQRLSALTKQLVVYSTNSYVFKTARPSNNIPANMQATINSYSVTPNITPSATPTIAKMFLRGASDASSLQSPIVSLIVGYIIWGAMNA